MSYIFKISFTLICALQSYYLHPSEHKNVHFSHASARYSFNIEVKELQYLPKFKDMMDEIGDEPINDITENIDDKETFDSLIRFFSLLSNNKNMHKKLPYNNLHNSLPSLQHAYNFLRVHPITETNKSDTDTILSKCAKNYVSLIQIPESITSKIIRWIFQLPLLPAYNWEQLTPLIQNNLPRNYLTEIERTTTCLFALHVVAEIIKTYKNIHDFQVKKKSAFYAFVTKLYYFKDPSSLKYLLNHCTFQQPSLVKICKNECWYNKNNSAASHKEIVLNNNPCYYIVGNNTNRSGTTAKTDSLTGPLLYTYIADTVTKCTVPEKIRYYVKILMQSIASETNLHTILKIKEPYHYPSLIFLTELAQYGTFYYDQTGLDLCVYPRRTESYISFVPNHLKSDPRNSLIILYYKPYWNADREGENQETFNKHKYPQKELNKWHELFEYVTHKKGNIDDIKKKYAIQDNQYDEDKVIQRYIDSHTEAASIEYVLTFPSIETLRKQCIQNKKPQDIQLFDHFFKKVAK